MIEVGSRACDFTADSTDGVFTLSERVKSGSILLYFYVVNHGRTCTDYIGSLIERSDDFRNLGITLVHVNPDTVENHLAWMQHTGSGYIHISDEGQAVSRAYDCIITKARSDRILGFTNRAFFLVDPDMTVRYAWRADMPEDTIPMDGLMDDLRGSLE